MICVMFVCHGNICRSPMAEYIFKKMVKEAGREDDFLIASSATSGEEIVCGRGNPIYPPAKAELSRRGVAFKNRRAIRLRKSDYGEYDYFLSMDRYNMRNMRGIFGDDPYEKCHLLLEFTPEGGEVEDPWYSGDFGKAFEDIERGCAAFLAFVTKEERQ